MNSSLVRCFLLIGGIAITSLWTSSVHGQSERVAPLSLQSLVESSSRIVEGRIISTRCEWDKDREYIYTIARIQVLTVFRGDAREYVEVVHLGGMVGNQSLGVTPSPRLNAGDYGLFVLQQIQGGFSPEHNSDVEQLSLVGSVHGYFRYDLIGNTASNQSLHFSSITETLYAELYSLTAQYIPVGDAPGISELIAEKVQRNASVEVKLFEPELASAGTRSVLTILGFNFGDAPGTVSFSNADDGGATFVDAAQAEIRSWATNKIEVYVPSQAGSGPIRVAGSDGSSDISELPLLISYAVANTVDNGDVVPTQLVDQDGFGGYTWQLHQDFDSSDLARAAFVNALDTWQCSSEVPLGDRRCDRYRRFCTRWNKHRAF